MKELINIIFEDIKTENFSKKEIIIYGVILPLSLILIVGIVGWIETLLSEL